MNSKFQHVGSFSCGMWDLAPVPRVEPQTLCIGSAESLATGPPGNSLPPYLDKQGDWMAILTGKRDGWGREGQNCV